MKKIQVIGLPGSGKTTGIELYRDGDNTLSLLDLRNFTGRYREASFIQAIRNQDQDLIAESACGVDTSGTYIVKLEIPRSQLIENLAKRGEKLDKRYLNYLIGQTLPANYTVNTSQDLVEILTTIFKRY
jgi:broad-specificity NMP kinase